MPNLNLEVRRFVLSFNEVRIHDKLEEELVEVSRNVDALEPRVVVLVHQDEVRVELHAAIFADNQAYLVLFASVASRLANRAIFNQL